MVLAAALLGCVIPQAASAESFALSKVAEPSSECGVCMAIRVPTVPASSADAVGPDLEGSGVKGGLDPKDLREAYELPATGGSSQTVAVVDAYNDPYAESDLQEYRKEYKVYFKGTETACTEANHCFTKINQKGETKNYPANNSGWSGEISLDLDMVSAACPECHILLVEASGEPEELSSLIAANEEAAKWEVEEPETKTKRKATEVTNSWGGVESPEDTSNDKYFDHPGLPTFAAAGDVQYDGCDHKLGAGICYPAASQYVIAVGGVKLTKKGETWKAPAQEVWKEESRSNGTGSGCSKYEPTPPGQKELSAERSHCEHRLDNDVSADAAVESAVSVRDSYYEGGWEDFGGTSASSPFVAAVDAHATSATQLLGADAFYKKASMLSDVIKGNNGKCTPPTEDEYFCTAETGYDGPTGEGTPDNVFTSIVPAGATGFATTVKASEATLNGIVNPNGATTKYYFEYGITESYGTKTAEVSVGSGTSNLEESKAITGLTGGTKYDVRIVTTNSNGTTDGLNQVFTTTVVAKPKVETKAASSVTETGATLNGTVNPEGSETKYYFEYGTTESYGSKTAEASAGSGTSNVEESKAIAGLTTNTIYHFRIVATNGGGTTDGTDHIFATSWAILPTLNPSGATGSYLMGTSCTSSNACTAVGDYTNSSGKQVPLAEYWNGKEWAIETTPSAPKGIEYHSLDAVSCTSSEACTAVGRGYSEAEGEITLAERWNGKEWSVQSMPKPTKEVDFLLGVSCTSSTACTAAGVSDETVLAEHWNGTEWSIQSTPAISGATSAEADGVSCTSASECTLVGQYNNSSGEIAALAERWSGTTWSTQKIPDSSEGKYNYLHAVSCSSSEACTAVGEHETSSGGWSPLVESWNGKEWSIQSTPTSNNVFWGVSCTSSTACTAVGGESEILIESWNGKEWSVQKPANPTGSLESRFFEVSCISSTECITTGYYENSSKTAVTLAELYN
ncbi:MAG TPA: hypothetical protein VIH71_15070 [Solirubrobacteraceae bacterium]